MRQHQNRKPPQPHRRPVHIGDAAIKRLAQLDGLTVGTIHRALAVGDQGRREVSGVNRSNYAGTRMQGDTFGELAERLVLAGWTKASKSDDTLERLHGPSGRIALSVNSGTCDVGDPDSLPSTSNNRGPAGIQAIGMNQLQLFALDPVTENGKLGWIVLFYVDESSHGQIFCEVSLAEQCHGGKIVSWNERIILPPLAPPTGLEIVRPPVDFSDPVVDVPVIRRAVQ